MSTKKAQITFSSLVVLIIALFIFLVQNLEIPFHSSLVSPASPAFSPPPHVELPAKLPHHREQIITHTGFTVSYNHQWKIPNWVAYVLTAENLEGEVPRYNTFRPDPNIPTQYSATNDDYRNTGWDRGHMAPAADMKWSEQAMIESFYFSNICPQNRKLNAGMWKVLEEQVRALASQKGVLYIVCGPIVSDNPRTIGENNVVVPDSFFKCLLQWHGGEWHTIATLILSISTFTFRA